MDIALFTGRLVITVCTCAVSCHNEVYVCVMCLKLGIIFVFLSSQPLNTSQEASLALFYYHQTLYDSKQ